MTVLRVVVTLAALPAGGLVGFLAAHTLDLAQRRLGRKAAVA